MVKEAEDLWLQLLDEDPLDFELFLGLSTEFAKKGHAREATTLLLMSINPLLEEQLFDEAMQSIKKIAELSPHDAETAAKICDFFKIIYKDFPELDKIFVISGCTDVAKKLSQSIELFETLTAFKAQDFCKHNSWGIGQIQAVDIEKNMLTIDFYSKKNHRMDIGLAVKALMKIDDNDISVLKYKHMDKLQDLADSDPVELVKIVLKSFDSHEASADDILEAISMDVIGQKNWKKWWERTKNLLKDDPYVTNPENKQKSYRLLDSPVSLEKKVLTQYAELSNFKEKLSFITTKLKKQRKEQFNDAVYEEICQDLAKIIELNFALNPSLALDTFYTLSSLVSQYPKALEYTKCDAKAILINAQNLGDTVRNMDKLEFQKQALKDIKDDFPERWADIYLDLLNYAPSELISDIIDELQLLENHEVKIKKAVQLGYDLIGDAEELLFWLANNLWNARYKPFLGPFATIALVEKLIDLIDLHESGVIETNHKIVSKIKNLILKNNYSFIVKLIKNSDHSSKIHVAKTIYDCSSLDKLTKQSILAKFITNCPEVKELLKSEEIETNAVYSSQDAYEKKQKEYYQLVNELIPQNARSINTARAHGDLRENFEYKAAKEEQARLLRKKAELENILAKIRIIDYSKVDAHQVSIGTRVHMVDMINKKDVILTIMGIWDSDPDNGIIAYLAPMAQYLIGKKVSEEAKFKTFEEDHHYRILKIEPISG